MHLYCYCRSFGWTLMLSSLPASSKLTHWSIHLPPSGFNIIEFVSPRYLRLFLKRCWISFYSEVKGRIHPATASSFQKAFPLSVLPTFPLPFFPPSFTWHTFQTHKAIGEVIFLPATEMKSPSEKRKKNSGFVSKLENHSLSHLVWIYIWLLRKNGEESAVKRTMRPGMIKRF